MNDLLTPADLAEKFDVNERTIHEWRKAYKWPCVKVGRRYRWTPEQLEQILRTHSVKAGKITTADGRTRRSANARRSA